MMREHFLVTGGTGLVGKNIIPRILRTFPDSEITLLVRARTSEEAKERVAVIADSIARLDAIENASSRMHGLRGDVSLEDLGLPPSDRSKLVRMITHIIHGAATVRFDHPLDEARAINCGGTARMLALAEECMSRGSFRRFVYVGSSSVSGKREGHVYEHELEMGQEFFNTYEHSKNESERLVRNCFDKFPCTVFRPSIIIGDSRSGRTSSFNVIYIPLRLLQRGLLTYVPGTPDTKMDLVPIDWVADTFVTMMNSERSVGKVLHQTAGPARAATLGEVVLSAIRFFDAHAPLARPRTMEFITNEEFEQRRSVMRGREEALMSQLDTLLPYVSVNRLFDSRNADALLEGSGIMFPRFTEYADRIFDYCLKTNWGKVNEDIPTGEPA